MPDLIVSITNEEVTVLESFHESAEEGIRFLARRHIKIMAGELIRESDSPFDPKKLDTSALRSEIQNLTADDKIRTYLERYPERAPEPEPEPEG